MQKEQYIKIDEDGNKFYFCDKAMTTYHREDGPAFEGIDGSKEWRRHGELHREDGPAYEGPSGDKIWYRNGELHREDGPAIESADGTIEWWYNNWRVHPVMVNKVNEDKAKIALLRKTIKDLIADFGGQLVRPDCNCDDCVYLRPFEAALKATE